MPPASADIPAAASPPGPVRVGIIMGSRSDWPTLGHAAATLAIGRAGAVNAALLAAAILAGEDPALAARLDAFRAAQTEAVPEGPEDPP